MAETAISAVLSKLGELATREGALLLQVGEDIMLLRDRLEWLQAFIRDADRKRRVGADDFTRVWVRQTRDVAFEAEDALDEFFHQVDLGSQTYGVWNMVHKFMTSFWTQITVRHSLSGRIKRIKSRLDQISENQKEYNIDHAPSGISASSMTALAPWDKLQEPVGLEKDAETLCSLLLHKDHPEQMFISLLGESGVGKTTLITKRILPHMGIRKRFKDPIVYIMPPDSSMEDLLREVYKRACGRAGRDPQDGSRDIAENLRDLLADIPYLVILGGISSIAVLNYVGASLPDGKNGSRVLLILEPESEEVARHADGLNMKTNGIKTTHRLSRLDEETSRHLFQCRVFGKEGKEQDDRNEQGKHIKEKNYGNEVHDITQGHPLAIVVLAGLLRYKEKPVEWDAVLQALKPGMEDAEDCQDSTPRGVLLLGDKPVEWKALQQPARETKLSNRMVIERIFSASFDDLPQDLKSCFLYFAAYPMNTTHSADRIVRMWTAEGFIKPQKGRTLEEVGHRYLKELISRCLVELISDNGRGGISMVRVHNRLLGFLQSEAREASFIEVHDRNDILAPATVRRLSIQNDSGTYATFSNIFPKLRSFICRVAEESLSSHESGENKMRRHEVSLGSRLACVYSSPVMEGGGGHDLKFVCGSKFLRLICVTGLSLHKLPDEIGDMIHLRYLRVDCTELDNIPNSIRGLLNLQTLDISKTKVHKIHRDFWKINTLRHVLANRLTLPNILLDVLGELQTLLGVAAEMKWDEGSSPLEKMTNLRSLDLHGFKAADHEPALERAISKMHLLVHLKLEGDLIPLWLFTKPILPCLQTMELDFPSKCPEVKWDDLRKVRPNLAELKLINVLDVPQKLETDMGKKLIKEKLSAARPVE